MKWPVKLEWETSAADPKKKFRIMTAAVPEAGCGMRITALFRSAKDAYFHLLFDNESGDLLALMAGRELNIWRTGSPAGVASRYLAPSGAKTLGLWAADARLAGNWSPSAGPCRPSSAFGSTVPPQRIESLSQRQ